MELGSKVTALEEEISVLKGEIKAILQEVRTAVLARENPFVADTSGNPQIPAVAAEPPVLVDTPTVADAPQIDPSPKVVQLRSLEEMAQPETPTAVSIPEKNDTDAAPPIQGDPQGRQRWSVGSLATLIAWTQETTTRMDASDLDIVLSLARYGGLIDEELESTLTKLSAPLFQKDSQPRPRGVTDYLLALRELSALLEEAEDSHKAPRPLRRVS